MIRCLKVGGARKKLTGQVEVAFPKNGIVCGLCCFGERGEGESGFIVERPSGQADGLEEPVSFLHGSMDSPETMNDAGKADMRGVELVELVQQFVVVEFVIGRWDDEKVKVGPARQIRGGFESGPGFCLVTGAEANDFFGIGQFNNVRDAFAEQLDLLFG